ncbi:MAG: putative SnoaL-like aldol condensation-catalyzing enzyme [Rhodothermales bacterium]|jgi:predicted SnoaL-like aldol condensation-catalyzing enzyme
MKWHRSLRSSHLAPTVRLPSPQNLNQCCQQLGVSPCLSKRKEQICGLLKGIETGAPESVAVVSQDRYIQHNPQTREGGEGLAALFKRLSQASPRVNIARIFADGDYVFGHTEYDFSSRRIGFEAFRFEGDYAVEHWDNIQSRMGPNECGHSMVDGETKVADLDKTEGNRDVVSRFVTEVLVGGQIDTIGDYVDAHSYTEQNPRLADGLPSLNAALSAQPGDASVCIRYQKLHKLLAEGNFVLAACEGVRDGAQTAFYDLYRLGNGKIVEHWDTTEAIPPRTEWKNENGKF